jgi:hypothetical protein
MAELTRRQFSLGLVGFLVLPAHHRPGHAGGPKPSPSPSPTPTPEVGLYSDSYSETY